MKMMRWGAGIALAVGVAGCGYNDPELEAAPVGEPDAYEAPSTDLPVGQVGITVSESPEFNAYISTAEGRALYMLEADEPGTSTCDGACLEVWPAFIATSGEPAALDPGVQEDLIGTIERADGSMQVTYGGHPLYLYAEDQGIGFTSGHDVEDQWGDWYLVLPSGEAVHGEDAY